MLLVPLSCHRHKLILIIFFLVLTVLHLSAEAPIKVLCGACEQSNQMLAGLCNACYHLLQEFQPLRKRHTNLSEQSSNIKGSIQILEGVQRRIQHQALKLTDIRKEQSLLNQNKPKLIKEDSSMKTSNAYYILAGFY